MSDSGRGLRVAGTDCEYPPKAPTARSIKSVIGAQVLHLGSSLVGATARLPRNYQHPKSLCLVRRTAAARESRYRSEGFGSIVFEGNGTHRGAQGYGFR